MAPLTEQEKKLYDVIDFNFADYRDDIGFDHEDFIHKTKQENLMARWRYPSLSIHGIEGAFYGPGAKTVIPRKVIGKFSIRVVPHQTIDHLVKIVKAHLESEFAKLKSPNLMKMNMIHGAKAWLGDFNDQTYVAATTAWKKVQCIFLSI